LAESREQEGGYLREAVSILEKLGGNLLAMSATIEHGRKTDG
jgi:hypothetical protein